MTDTTELERTQRAARDYLSNIESTLAAIQRMVEQSRDNLDIVTDSDIAVFDRVLHKLSRTEDTLSRTEDAWSAANQLLDNWQRDADARDERETQADALGVGVQ